MAQARVTDYFAQSKKGRPVRSNGLKESGDAVITKPRTSSRATRKTTHDPESQKHVQQEFLRVIDEALSAEPVQTATDSRAVSDAGLTASPRTPKRTATEFDVCSVLFPSAAEQHSTAKKRLRLSASQNRRTSPEERAGPRGARKKLDLLRNDDKAQVPIAKRRRRSFKCGYTTNKEHQSSLNSLPRIILILLVPKKS